LKDLLRLKVPQEVEEEISVGDLDFLFGGALADRRPSAKGAITGQLTIGKPKKSEVRIGEPTLIPDPESVQGGRGAAGGEGSHKSAGGNIPDPDGTKDVDGVKVTGRQVRDFRVVRKTQAKNVVSIYFTPVTKGEYFLSLFRSGETEREPVSFRLIGESEWVKSYQLRAKDLSTRVALDLELNAEDFLYALEGVMRDAS
jgi:hypothetical protein